MNNKNKFVHYSCWLILVLYLNKWKKKYWVNAKQIMITYFEFWGGIMNTCHMHLVICWNRSHPMCLSFRIVDFKIGYEKDEVCVQNGLTYWSGDGSFREYMRLRECGLVYASDAIDFNNFRNAHGLYQNSKKDLLKKALFSKPNWDTIR